MALSLAATAQPTADASTRPSSRTGIDVSKNHSCDPGDGNVVMIVSYEELLGGQISAHSPSPTGVTWNATLPTNMLAQQRLIAFATPLTSGTFALHSNSNVYGDIAFRCQNKTVRSGTPDKVWNLGDKSCASQHVEITGYSASGVDTWFFWRSNAGGTLHHMDFSSFLGLNSLVTNDKSIYDVQVKTYDPPDPGQPSSVGAALDCGPS